MMTLVLSNGLCVSRAVATRVHRASCCPSTNELREEALAAFITSFAHSLQEAERIGLWARWSSRPHSGGPAAPPFVTPPAGPFRAGQVTNAVGRQVSEANL